jgi:hypothetical protein
VTLLLVAVPDAEVVSDLTDMLFVLPLLLVDPLEVVLESDSPLVEPPPDPLPGSRSCPPDVVVPI